MIAPEPGSAQVLTGSFHSPQAFPANAATFVRRFFLAPCKNLCYNKLTLPFHPGSQLGVELSMQAMNKFF